MDESLEEILKRFWEWRLDEAPEFGTMVGDHKRDGELDDFSITAYDERLVSVMMICNVRIFNDLESSLSQFIIV